MPTGKACVGNLVVEAGDLDRGGADIRDHSAEVRVTGHLIVISGLPGVGKTSLAEISVARLGSVRPSIDAVEESIPAFGLPSGWQTGVAAYEATRAMAELNLLLGRSVVVDAVNDSEEARQTWRSAASRTGAHIDFVHLVIPDVREHRRRLRGRDRGLAFVGEPTWLDVVRRRAGYAAWTDEVIELDAEVRTADEIAGVLCAHLGPSEPAHRRSLSVPEHGAAQPARRGLA